MRPAALTLSVPAFIDEQRWRWRLSGESGEMLGEHDVTLDAGAPEYEAWVDLDGYLRTRVAPDTPEGDAADLVRGLGVWIARSVLGPLADRLVASGGPVTVRVVLPSDAAVLTQRPFQLAMVGGTPLALQNVTFVFELESESPPLPSGEGDGTLRILAVFSLPASENPLGLRQERRELQNLFKALARTHRVEARVVQYGVTLELLQRVLGEAARWDLVHVSGHGNAGTLLLEKSDGTPHEVEAATLVQLLQSTRQRLKCVTMSSCLSGAEDLAETRRDFELRDDADGHHVDRPAVEPDRRLPGVARALTGGLDCAVVAMRYAVDDRFAAEFTTRLYDTAIRGGVSLPAAVESALPAAVQASGAGPLAIATPVLFGRWAAALTLSAAERDKPAADSGPLLPQTEPYFVGRGRVMADASAALAPASGTAGVWFVGMSGIGKTACATELIDLQWSIGRFDGFLSYSAPRLGEDAGNELNRFAQHWDRAGADPWQPTLPMVGVPPGTSAFDHMLRQLRDLLERRSLLVVLDNVESLLSPNGVWKIDGFEQIVSVLLSHHGHSRTILTSRVRPIFGEAYAPLLKIRDLWVNTLTIDESLLLARQLPNLGNLIRGRADSREQRAKNHDLVKNVLRVVQGHPKLIQMAEKLAADREALAACVRRALDATSNRSALDAFFVRGTSEVGEEDTVATLGHWTRDISASLPNAVRNGFAYLCCLEEEDRLRQNADALWLGVGQRLAENASVLLERLVPRMEDVGLVEVRDTEKGPTYYIHPGVAGFALAALDNDVRASIEGVVAEYWSRDYEKALTESGSESSTEQVLASGQKTVPYLLRLGEWDRAADILEEIRYRNETHPVNEWLLTNMRRVLDHTSTTSARYGRNLRILGSIQLNGSRYADAARSLEEAATHCQSTGNYKEASVALDELVDMYHKRGRITDASRCLDQMKQCTAAANLGEWSRLVDDTWELLLWHDEGRDAEAFQRFERVLEPWMAALEDLGEHTSDEHDPADSWTAREFLLDVARQVAFSLGDWASARKFTKRALKSQKNREAPPMEIAEVEFNGYRSLIRLGELDEAARVIARCRQEFDNGQSTKLIGDALAAVAELDHARGDVAAAVREEAAALRWRYQEQLADSCALGHAQFAAYLAIAGGEPATVGAHYTAAALIRYRIWDANRDRVLAAATAAPEHQVTSAAPTPATYLDLCGLVEATEEIAFRELVETLTLGEGVSSDPQWDYEQVIDILAKARAADLQAPGAAGAGV